MKLYVIEKRNNTKTHIKEYLTFSPFGDNWTPDKSKAILLSNIERADELLEKVVLDKEIEKNTTDIIKVSEITSNNIFNKYFIQENIQTDYQVIFFEIIKPIKIENTTAYYIKYTYSDDYGTLRFNVECGYEDSWNFINFLHNYKRISSKEAQEYINKGLRLEREESANKNKKGTLIYNLGKYTLTRSVGKKTKGAKL